MKRSKVTEQQIVFALKQAETGVTVAEGCRKMGVSEATFYNWKYDYGSNPPLYPSWQAYFRKHQPPTLIVWGKNDPIFPAEGAYPYKRDLKNVEFNLLDTGHFALEEEGETIANHIRNFMGKRGARTGGDGVSGK